MQKARVIASLDHEGFSGGEVLWSITDTVDALEVRADVLGHVYPDGLRDRFGGELIFALRSEAQGGRSDASDSERAQLLVRAAERYDMIELESERDCREETLAVIPPERRILSWYGTASDDPGLRKRFDRISSVPASMYKMVTTADRSGDEVAPLGLLKQ